MSEKFITKLNNYLQENPLAIQNAISLADIVRGLGYSANGRYTKIVRSYIEEHDIDISHFSHNGKEKPVITQRICPQCGVTFSFRLACEEKETCSKQCANIYFAYKQGAKNAKDSVSTYKSKLNKFYSRLGKTRQCVCCTEQNVLDVHHIDEDRTNISLDNLVYLCPTHHAYLHRLNAEFVFIKIAEYLDSIEEYL